MKKIYLLTMLFTLCGFVLMAQTLSVSPNNSNIQYAGRIDFSDPGAPSFSIPGASITVAFNGTEISGNFSSSGTSYVYVVVDGNDNPYEREVIEIGGNNVNIVLASGLSVGDHTVMVMKTNEYDTKIKFNGFTVNGTGLLDPPARPAKKIEFYGDSNASGWSAWDVRDEGHNNLSGAYHTYPGLTARMLDAEYSNMSAGGWGVTPETRRMNINDVYNRIHIADRATTDNIWDFNNNYWNFKADVVVINLGANDYYNGASKEQIIDGWNQLVSSIRIDNPQAHVVMVNSYGWAFDEPADYTHEFVAARHAMGDANVSTVLFPWLWSDYHAVINEHAGFANILATHIANVMGWPAPTLSSLSSFGVGDNVGNGSFESSLIDGFADGWRPFASWSYPEYVSDASVAFHGNSFLRCPDTYGVMHANIAAPGDVFDLSVWAKTIQGTKGRLKYEFRNQGQGVIVADMVDVTLGSSWEQITLTTQAAPQGTWQINVILEAIDGSTVDFDLAHMQKSGSGAIVDVTGVTLSETNLELIANETFQLSESVAPANATDKNVSWSSSNASVASVNINGLVTAQSEGTTQITVTTNDGEYTAICTINVTSGNPGSTMHVVSITEGTQSAGGPNNKATAMVFVENELGEPVANATVTGSFSGDFNETVSASTGSDGSVTIVSWSKKKGTVTVDFCVDNVEHNSLSYLSSENLITCSGGVKALALGQIDQEASLSLDIYPNPAKNGEVKISTGSINSQIEIFNPLGKLIKKVDMNGSSELTLDVSMLNTGIYLIRTCNKRGSESSKLIIP